MPVPGKAKIGEPGGNGRLGHFAGRIFAVAHRRVVVQPCANLRHFIVSCFTLWSITWREASSARISSGEMPSSTISTSAW